MSVTTEQFSLERLLEKLCGGKPPSAAAQAQQAEVIVTSNTAKPPLYALLIGINDYETITKLKAAVPDIKRFKEYLMTDLLVPEDQITMILDQQAKRQNIIQAFRDLAKDPRIQKDDPIVIYYAGHGSEIDPPEGRKDNGPLVQCIIPQDTSKITGVVPIPDFVIGSLLTNLANEKGNNITVIFDCCHSAGGSRDDEGARYIEKDNLPKLPANTDAGLLAEITGGTRALVQAQGFLNAGMASHVLLAACSHAEVAFEDGRAGHGYFSTALLTLLRSMKIDNLTYKGCMQRLPTLQTRQPQNPVCEGQNIDRLFFNAKVPGANNQFIAIKKQGPSLKPYLQAGVAQGITTGCTFAVHADHVIGEKNPEIGRYVVATAEPFRSLLKIPEGGKPIDFDDLVYGRQVGYGPDQELKIHLTDAFVNAATQDDKWRPAFTGASDNIVLRPTSKELAELEVDLNEEGRVTLTTTNSSAVAHGLQTIPYTLEPTAEEVIPALYACGKWSYHLRRMPGARPFQKAVTVEFTKLESAEEYDDEGNPVLKPVGENLNIGGEVDIVVKEEDLYGIKISNNSSRDLFCYIFFFSITDQSITPTFNPAFGSDKTDPSLPKGVPLTIGYGSSGVNPLAFALDEGIDLDAGIFKVFITTEQTDFDSVKQETPFGTRGVVTGNRVQDLMGKQPLWDVFTVTLVQRRYPKEQMTKPKPQPASVQPSEPVQPSAPAPSLKPAPVATSGALALFTGSRSSGPLKVSTTSGKEKTEPWFRSPAIDEGVLASISNMRLRALSRAEAPTSAAPTDNKTWFEVQIIQPNDEPRLDPDDMPFTYHTHPSPRGNDATWADGAVFNRSHEIWKNVKPGDRFEVYVGSKGPGWSNVAQEGNLVFW